MLVFRVQFQVMVDFGAVFCHMISARLSPTVSARLGAILSKNPGLRGTSSVYILTCKAPIGEKGQWGRCPP